MTFEELQSSWQSHEHGRRLTVDAELLLNEVRRNHRELEKSLLRRDIGEVLAAVLVTISFGTAGALLKEWTLFLGAVGAFFVGTFFVVDRWIQAVRRPASEDSLLSHVESSLYLIRHQIWLLKNVFWWYLFPLLPGMIGFLVSQSWNSLAGGRDELGSLIVMGSVGLICALTFWGVYLLNQQAVRNQLEPRREELESLKASLQG